MSLRFADDQSGWWESWQWMEDVRAMHRRVDPDLASASMLSAPSIIDGCLLNDATASSSGKARRGNASLCRSQGTVVLAAGAFRAQQMRHRWSPGTQHLPFRKPPRKIPADFASNGQPGHRLPNKR
ncbi:uncharacterized protein MYCFIDRAFT_170655 [Pseudocercospora fijiensis CIRAD86]|uniref:Uncharacterized protein n=1 Tax=Pseudocercospora fijiensis (strain CIRAD86) TaxID=383855 RepID=N1QAZ8_PSEFD|nr:uncharacterized protein MYCFIDRAFT_170655 [Pseudocercospora fijiensis CIRAD86]EME89141.1 hypothetical protein MYCFIDRAFT_170655 [Pseudocercospora fijiensis CIRAD86]